ncbi:MAG: glycine zipper 2TM domain-containing protein [Hyphomonadaceae bacterium]|nr:glycine zipper 2TM domain-containing protein [Hyphomonadaceae bacterium]
MRSKFIALAAVMALGVAACETTGGGYGGGYGNTGGTRLSSCMRNALIGAGVGAVAGAVAGSENNRGENAAIGAAVGGAATFGVCKYLDNQQQARIEGAYQNALQNNAPVGMNWVSTAGRTYVLSVQRPQFTPGQPNCRSINATLNVNNEGVQALPTETYCNNGGGWVPVA